MVRVFSLIFFLAGLIAVAQEFNYGDWELTLHPNGSWSKLYWKGKLICDNPEQAEMIWLKRENMRGDMALENAVMDEKTGTLVIHTTQGKWKFEEKIVFGKELRRQFSVVWTGSEPARMWEHNTVFPMPKQGSFFLPCSMFGDTRSYYSEITPFPNHNDQVRGEMKDLRTGTSLKGAMDHPGFVFFQSAPDLAVVLIADPAKLPGRAFLEGREKQVICKFYAASCGWALPGKKQTFPEFRLDVVSGTVESAMKTVPRRYYEETGLVPPPNREAWMLDASIYELELGRLGGALKAAEKRLPYIKKRGFNTLWVQPIEYLGPYNPENYFRIRKEIGTEEDYRKFIQKAHELGIRVLQDVVPHGSRPIFAEPRGVSPFTVSINDRGQCYVNECFDYSSPEWRKYFYGVISHWMKCGVDGFRIDQCGVSPANWRLPDFPKQAPKAFRKAYWDSAVAKNGGKLPPIEGARADDSKRIGPMKLTKGIRDTARSHKADAAILGEGGNYMQPYCDVVVDMPIRHTILKMLFFPPEEFTRRYLDTMDEKYWMDPPDIRRVSLYEIHDNEFRASQIVGEAASQALRTSWFWNRGIPLVMDGRELGQGVLIARLNLLRKNLEELRRGDIDFKAVKSKPLLFAPIRFMPGKSSICVTSFYPDPVDAELSVPLDKTGFSPEMQVDLFDSFRGVKLSSGKMKDFSKIRVKLPPYGSSVLTFRSAGSISPVQPEEPLCPAVSTAEKKLTVSESEEKIEIGGAFPLVIDRKTGMILCCGELFGASDILSDAKIPPIRPTVKVTRSAGEVRIDADFDSVFRLIYTVKPDSLEVQGILKRYSRDSRYAFLLNAQTARRWQVFGADGIRDDFIDPALVDTKSLGSLNGNYKEHIFSPVLYRSYTMPLNPAFPVIRLTDGRKHSVEVELNDPFDPGYDEIMLLNSMKETAGIHLAFFWNQVSPISTAEGIPRSFRFTIRPVSRAVQETPEVKINGIALKLNGIRWQADNGRFLAQFGKKGGVLESIRFHGANKAAVTSQDVIAKGFKTSFSGACRASYDMETQCRVLRTGTDVEFRFISWLRNFTNAGVLQPPVWDYTSYRIEPDGETLKNDWKLYNTNLFDSPRACLYWRADVNGKEVRFPIPKETAKSSIHQWLSFISVFSRGGVSTVQDEKTFAKRSYPPMMEWNIRSWRDQKNLLARLSMDLPENWKYKYIPDYRILPYNDRIVYQFELPVMWPHTTSPVELKPGMYRASTMVKTVGVKKTGAPGTLRFKLAYIDAAGKKQVIERCHEIPDGDHDWFKMSTEFRVPAGVAATGEFTTLAYKIFGKGTVQFEEPLFERIGD